MPTYREGHGAPDASELKLRKRWRHELRRRGLSAVGRIEEIAKRKARRGQVPP